MKAQTNAMKLARIILPVGLGVIIVGVVLSRMQATANNATQSNSGFITEYPIPTSSTSEPLNIAVESPGRVWFTMPISNAIGSLVVTSSVDFEFAFYEVPTPDSRPYDLAYDEVNGFIWFTERAGDKIGRLDIATKAINEYAITSTIQVSPTGIAVAPSGDVWFTEQATNRLGRFSPGISTFDTFTYTLAGAGLADVAVANDDSIWFTAPAVNQAVEFKPSLETFDSVAVVDVNTPPFPPGGLAIDNVGRPWVSSPDHNWIGPFLEGTLALWRWQAIPSSGDEPTDVAYSSFDGINYIWFVETAAGRVGHLAFDATDDVLYSWDQSLPTPGGLPYSIAADSNGHAWIAAGGSNVIAEWRPPYFVTTSLPIVLNNHDGTLGTPLFGVQMYGNTESTNKFHPHLLESEASWLRVTLSWETAEPTDTVAAELNWTVTDKILAAAREDSGGLNMIATIDDVPNWAQTVPGHARGPILFEHLDDFAEYVGVLVERFDGDGIDDAPGSPIVIHWELFNEPDFGGSSWGDFGQEYAQMLKAVYPAVKSANPDAFVVFGGIAYDWFYEQNGPFNAEFLLDVLQAGGGDYFDVMNFHYYPAFRENWLPPGDESLGLEEKAEAIRNELHQFGIMERPLINTEAGCASNEGSVNVVGSTEIQSRCVVEIYVESLASEVEVLIWWMLYDPGSFYDDFGLVTNEPVPVPKQSLEVYKATVAQLSTAHYERTLTPSETGASHMDVFVFKDLVYNRTTYVAWLNPGLGSEDINETKSLILSASSATVRDIFGNVIDTLTSSGGSNTVSVEVGGRPIFIELAGL